MTLTPRETIDASTVALGYTQRNTAGDELTDAWGFCVRVRTETGQGLGIRASGSS